jgi:hypothetical protein
MQHAFSRRALYRHRAKHMSAEGLPAARPILFPHEAKPVERIRWLQREAVLTARLAEQKGYLNARIKAMHELSRLIWLELRAKIINDPADAMQQYAEFRKGEDQRAEEARAAREAAIMQRDQHDTEIVSYF